MRLDEIPTPERRGRYWVDVARSYYQWGKPVPCYRTSLGQASYDSGYQSWSANAPTGHLIGNWNTQLCVDDSVEGLRDHACSFQSYYNGYQD